MIFPCFIPVNREKIEGQRAFKRGLCTPNSLSLILIEKSHNSVICNNFFKSFSSILSPLFLSSSTGLTAEASILRIILFLQSTHKLPLKNTENTRYIQIPKIIKHKATRIIKLTMSCSSISRTASSISSNASYSSFPQSTNSMIITI